MLQTALLAAIAARRDPAGLEFFEKKARPVFGEACASCHSAAPKSIKGGLRLDTPEEILKGGDTGPAIIRGKPDESLLVKAVRYRDPDLQMPPKKRLPEAAVADLAEWVAMGAPLPAPTATPAAPGLSGGSPCPAAARTSDDSMFHPAGVFDVQESLIGVS
jgi:mono/diheme cytochrome c family protein